MLEKDKTWWTIVGSYSTTQVGDIVETPNYYGNMPKVCKAIAVRVVAGNKQIQWQEIGWKPDKPILIAYDIEGELIEFELINKE